MDNNADPARLWRNPLFHQNPSAAKIAEGCELGEVLRRKSAAGLALGTFLIELPCISTVTAIALAGFDFVVLDMEHSSLDFSTLGPLIAAGNAAGMATLVRPWGDAPGLIGKALEMGANGILAPHVDTPDRARMIVSEARFPPLGTRSFSPLTRYDSLQEPFRTLDRGTYIVAQIEGRHAVERAAEIAAVEGIDAIFVGPYDLALSLGVQPGSQPVRDAIDRVAASVSGGTTLGAYIDDPTKSAAWAANRFTLQCIGFDGRMLVNGARQIVKQARDRQYVAEKVSS